jgi:hypothetical protein
MDIQNLALAAIKKTGALKAPCQTVHHLLHDDWEGIIAYIAFPLKWAFKATGSR